MMEDNESTRMMLDAEADGRDLDLDAGEEETNRWLAGKEEQLDEEEEVVPPTHQLQERYNVFKYPGRFLRGRHGRIPIF